MIITILLYLLYISSNVLGQSLELCLPGTGAVLIGIIVTLHLPSPELCPYSCLHLELFSKLFNSLLSLVGTL